MKKRINRTMWLLALFSIILTALSAVLVFYGVWSTQMKTEVREDAEMFRKNIEYEADDLAYLNTLDLSPPESRVTLLDGDGTVLYDSYMEADTLPSHAGRPEIQAAAREGIGENVRRSETLHREAYYYALKLSDGNILRLAKTSQNLYSMFLGVFPAIVGILFVIFLLVVVVGRQLVRKIVAPLNRLNLAEGEIKIYDELSPLVRTIIHQREQIREQMLDLESRANTIKTITGEMNEGLILLDSKGLILSLNHSACKFLHAEDGAYDGKSIFALTRDVEMTRGVKKALCGESSGFTAEQDGRAVDVFINPVMQDGTLTGVLALFLDVTEKAGAEKLRREFSANVSHELKTPLTTILGLSEMIESGMAKPEDVRGFSGKIREEVTRLINLIDDIISLSKLDEKGEKHREVFTLHTVAQEAAEGLQDAARMKGVTVNLSGGDFTVHANRGMLFELFYNLVDNAIKYNQEGGRVDMSIVREGNSAVIEVSDTGIGIPEEHIERIFERFYRVDRSRSKKTGGTGLGLSIVKHIAMHHNGSARIESKEGAGTKVTVMIEVE